jgi:serine/threonine protein kinase
VYKGTWRGRTVAIKCLAPATPRELFIREVNIWRELKHPNVLELYGASGASGDGPWFFVCPYERFGSLSTFLRRVAQEGDAGKNGKEGDLLRFMHEVAKGMEYLHDKGVLHGDLKVCVFTVVYALTEQPVGGEHPRRRPYSLPSLGFWAE